MNIELFGQPYDKSNPYWVLESYFDRMFIEGCFLKSVNYILHKDSFHVDGAYCSFPDLNSCYDEEHFEGVEFAYGYPPEEEDTIIVSEKVCYEYVHLACEKYLKLQPGDTEKVNSLLAKLPA
ncbi:MULTISPECIES: ribonuclease toxin immunity protein CdiI [Tenebrionibacter/Tenebrionicola group]|jgi:hypothetical protein|uniref:Ribonuclease toxin immunity protein CdiI n=2 Tax=Tenebrionibacter/Tenebrionicola group TaxID=2969848 RepID=A0A8K0V4W9_9ENTR|nr:MULTISPECIES: ribonuclease toxin immunity protein CdiI [Tenebrionibacter/Tenebrionicola group]MBK4717113.1 ribonuclease toxin immunity protein CdiI [Tenebrionibacter intestinalis]MBV5097630.1 ribonuclease toxin immunity protein CdiI [Tenebrionicola larvae]